VREPSAKSNLRGGWKTDERKAFPTELGNPLRVSGGGEPLGTSRRRGRQHKKKNKDECTKTGLPGQVGDAWGKGVLTYDLTTAFHGAKKMGNGSN